MMRSLEEVLEQHPLPLFKPDGSPSELNEMQKEDIVKLATMGRALGDLPVGYGKTAIATCVALMLRPPVTVVLMPPILTPQWVKWLGSIPGAGRVVDYTGGPAKRRDLPLRGAQWVVMSYGMFRNDFDRLKAELVDPMLIVDECFPAGTQVQVPAGQVSIETLKPGDEVLTSAGVKPIMKVFKALAFQLSTLELSDGSAITCTPDHPIFTDLGWMRAADCEGRFVLADVAVSDLQQGVQPKDLDALACEGEGHLDRDHLFKILHDETSSTGESGIVQGCRAEDERHSEIRAESGRDQARTAQLGAQGSDLIDATGDGMEATSEEGKRHWHDSGRNAAGAGAEGSGLRLECGGQPRSAASWLSDELQAGLCSSDAESRSGAGWPEPCCGQTASTGSKEGSQAGRTWVARVSTAEQSTGTPVFNLHVEGRHDYFAGGILVHNCQNLKNYKSQLFKNAKLFSDGQPLLLMSGTIMSKPGDGYSYVKLNNPEVYRTYAMFENIHVAKRDFFDQPVEWQHLDLLQDNLDLSRVRRTKEEVHANLPKVNYVVVEYDLAPEHMKLYRRLMDEQLLEVEDGKIDATTAGRLYAAAQQIIANWAYFSDSEDNVPKLFELIDEILDEIGLGEPAMPGEERSKLILWTNYQRTSARVLSHLNARGAKTRPAWRAVGAYGAVNSKEGVRAFMEDADALVLVAQPGSAGAGLNPQGFTWEMGFVETPTTTIPFVQCCGRIDRTGQRFNPTIRLFVARGTIQEGLLRNLFANDSLVQQAGGSKQAIKDLIFPK